MKRRSLARSCERVEPIASDDSLGYSARAAERCAAAMGTIMDAADYSLHPVPSTVAPLVAFAWHPTIVDYGKHSAYAPFARLAVPSMRARALATWTSHFGLLLAKRIIRYEAIPGEYRAARTLGDRLGFVRHALANAVGIGRRVTKAKTGNDVWQKFDRDGVAVIAMPAPRLAELTDLARPYFDALVARRGVGANKRAFDDSRATTDRRNAAPLFALVEAIFAESGLQAATDAYVGRKTRLIDINPQINDPTDSFWRDIFEDVDGTKLPSTAYCHRDASGGDIKIIIYLTEVGPRNGPFNYAVGSNHMKISALDNLLCEANDHNGLSVTSVEARRLFAALPSKLQQKGLFGNDLDDDSPESLAIAGSLWPITGSAGLMVAFDTKGIHRGGMVIEGERRVLTCVLG